MRAKYSCARRRASAAHHREPVEVGGDRRVVLVDTGEHTGHHVGDRPGGDQVEERPGALAVLVDHARLGEQLEVPGDARLALPEDVGEVGDRQLAVLEQGDDPQPGLLADGTQHVEHRLRAESRHLGHGLTI